MSESDPSSLWRKVESILESRAGYYGAIIIMLAVMGAVLFSWYV